MQRLPGVGLVLCAAASLLIAAPAWARHGPPPVAAIDPSAPTAADRMPRLRVEAVLEVQNDFAHGSEGNELFAKLEPAVVLELDRGLALHSKLVLEPVEDRVPGQSRTFSDHGLFVEELYASAALGDLALRAGKLNPPFGRAWDLAPGIYGVDFAEDYELTERLGAGARYTFATGSLGEHRVSADVFTADTSHLSRSLGRGRSRLHRSDGGPSNSGRLDSAVLALDGEPVPGLSYHFGLAHQASARGGRREHGRVAALHYAAPFAGAARIELLGELARLDECGGEAGRACRYATASLAVAYHHLVLALAHTARETDAGPEDFLLEASIGYFQSMGVGDLGLELAYRRAREEDEDTGVIGARLTWSMRF